MLDWNTPDKWLTSWVLNSTLAGLHTLINQARTQNMHLDGTTMVILRNCLMSTATWKLLETVSWDGLLSILINWLPHLYVHIYIYIYILYVNRLHIYLNIFEIQGFRKLLETGLLKQHQAGALTFPVVWWIPPPHLTVILSHECCWPSWFLTRGHNFNLYILYPHIYTLLLSRNPKSMKVGMVGWHTSLNVTSRNWLAI